MGKTRPKMKACPFCGETRKLMLVPTAEQMAQMMGSEGTDVYVYCFCTARGPTASLTETLDPDLTAVERWNKRADD